MILLAAKKLLDREPSAAAVPIILDRYANSAGSIIVFHLHSPDFGSGDK